MRIRFFTLVCYFEVILNLIAYSIRNNSCVFLYLGEITRVFVVFRGGARIGHVGPILVFDCFALAFRTLLAIYAVGRRSLIKTF